MADDFKYFLFFRGPDERRWWVGPFDFTFEKANKTLRTAMRENPGCTIALHSLAEVRRLAVDPDRVGFSCHTTFQSVVATYPPTPEG